MNSRPRFSLRSMLFSVAVIAVGVFAFVALRPESEVVRKFGGRRGMAALKNPDRVDGYRLSDLPPEVDWHDAGVADYPINSGPVALSKFDAQKVGDILSDASSYVDQGYAKACVFRPGVRLDFIRGNERLQVLLCFECDHIVNFLNGEFLGGHDIEGIRPALVRAIRLFFPDDRTIQALREQH